MVKVEGFKKKGNPCKMSPFEESARANYIHKKTIGEGVEAEKS